MSDYRDKNDEILQRGVAQSGSAPGLGPGGRRFESCRPDKQKRLFLFRRAFLRIVCCYTYFIILTVLLPCFMI